MKKILLSALVVILGCAACLAVGQGITIAGQVTDPDGKPIEKVSVNVKGEVYGTATDLVGRYSFMTSPETKILVFSAEGYLTKEEVIGGRSEINVQLERDPDAVTRPPKTEKKDKKDKKGKKRKSS